MNSIDNYSSEDLNRYLYPEPQYYTAELLEYEMQQEAAWESYCKLNQILQDPAPEVAPRDIGWLNGLTIDDILDSVCAD